jgi:gamma-glutamyltranspeptidase/glutathione hydrolase
MLAMNAHFAAVLAAGLAALGTIPAAAQRKESDRPVRLAERGTRGAVTAGTSFGTDAGMRLYHAGGNAVDAGVAAMFAAAITEYSHFGFGGEAPILIYAKGKVHSIAGVGTMPKLASAELFRTRKLLVGEVMNLEPNGLRGFVPVAGLMPALVPSMPDSGLLALRDFGTKSFAEVIAPAIDLADGTPMDEMRAGAIRGMRRFAEMWPTTKATFFPNGRAPQPGEIFRQPALAATLRSLVAAEKKALAQGKTRTQAIDAVRDHFYRGDIARRIAAFVESNQGLLRYEDFAAFKLEVEEPVAADYRGHRVYKPSFWSQGPAMIEALNILEGIDLKSMGYNSADYLHTVVEALKLAYADRDTYYGDPKFVKVPAQLLTPEYARTRRQQISARASLDFRPGAIDGKAGRHPSQEDIVRVQVDDALMARDTTCINAIDKDGIAFSATPSGAWTPSVIAGDTGIPLTQRAQSFLLVRGHPNELAGGKRPRVTLSPTLVTRDGKAVLVLSTPGGDNQEQSLLQVLLNVVEFGMNAQQAVEAPRFQTRHLVSSFDNHAMSPGDLLLDERIAPSVSAELAARGHKVEARTKWGSGAAPTLVRIIPGGVIEAGADPFMHRSARAW